MNKQIEIDSKKLNRMRTGIYFMEKDNQRTSENSDNEMKKKIQKLIKEVADAY